MKRIYTTLVLLLLLNLAFSQTTYYVNDNSTSNDAFTSSTGSDINPGTAALPFATIQHAADVATEGSIIYIDAGIYFEQVTLNKGLSLFGVNSGVTIVWKPAVTNPPPGPFTEQGTIQTAQNIGDVHIKDMSVTGDDNGVTPIVLQTGGSVKYCRLINGNQGIFFRVDPAIKTAVIENNYINVQYIGINCQGSGLTATLINNTINLNNPFFAAGVFAGLDFGPLVRFTAFGNMINNYNAQGFLANSYNTNITQNSILGTGQHAIEQGTNSLAFATCNWFGTTNAATIASKVSGLFSYTPYLTNGTNTNTTYGNYSFVPVAGACGEGVNNFYVNDNSRTNDVFTTAVGSNANSGTSNAPFATLSYAISVAPANSVIHVDAGMYAEQVIIDRGIVINGAGRELTNFIKPASALVPAPGPFTEIGLIETTQGIADVHIRNISVNSVDGTSQNIIIQSGGSVKNCKLLNGGQGVFFRIASGSRTATVEANVIQPLGIGINCQGAGLSASILSNSISNPSGYYSGIFAGLDFGFLPQITITNNKISGYSSTGILANATSSNVTNNSIIGTQGIAIQGNALNATCNWYGSNTPAIAGPVIYSPFLTNGTDNDVYSQGFQPVPGSCNGIQHRFYVNDNSTIGNVFTSAVGNDANSGVPSAPLLTIGAALTKASAGDTIFVDAGTYVLSADLTIGKAVTILGTNYLLSPNDANDKRVLNALRNAESIVSNATLIIGSNDISIQGMVLDPGTAAIAVFLGNGSNYNNISLSKNRLKMNSLSPAVRFEGQGTNTIAVSALVNTGFTITDNRFEKYDAGHSFAINISRLKNVNVTNNAFVVGGSTLRNYTAIVMGNVGVIDAITFSANTIDKALNAINGSRMGSAVLNGNKIYNTTNAINSTNGIPESSNIEFSNNLLDGSAGIFPFVFYTRNGGSTAGSSSLFKTENNTITGTAVPSITILLGSYNITFSNTVLSPSLIIRNNIFNYSGDLSTVEGQFLRPIAIKGNLANATVDHNELTLSGINLQPKNPASALPACPAISLYTDNGPSSGIPAGAVINILNNKVHGFKHSFVVFDPVNGSDPYTGFGNLGPNISVNVHDNSFTADSMSINNGSVGYPINASCNWYGYSAIQNLVSKLSTDLDNIYIPYLTNGTDSDPATGFQPAPGSCNGQPLQARLDGFTNVTCNGANNGTASVTVFNGVAPYVFAWTKDGDPLFSSSVEDPTNFGPGTYHLSITDALGTNLILDENEDIRTIDVTITEPPLLTSTGSGTNNLCYGNTAGTASVLAGDGTAPYTYLWSNNETTAGISNLAAGIYSVTVTDANGCTANSSYEVTEPTLLTATASGTNIDCNGNNTGSASVNVTGGTGAYSYLWSNSETTSSISNLSAGTYSVTVTDANGCTANSSYKVTEPAILTATASGTNVSCFGGNNGTVSLNVTGGTEVYSYSWSNGATTSSVNNLTAGIYSVTVTDAHGCTASSSYQVTEPTALTASAVVVNNTCYNGTAGSITVAATGGTGSYTYSLNGTNYQPGNVFNSLAALAYTVYIQDANGCIVTTPAVITQPPAIIITISNITSACAGTSNGAISSNATGGTGTLVYSWIGPNGFTKASKNISNLAAGVYNLTVTDANGCMATKQVTAPGLPAITASAAITSVQCYNTSTGAINLTAGGGSGAFSFSWTGSNGYKASTEDISNLKSGTYFVTITDAAGCSFNQSFIVNQPVALTASAAPTNINVCGGTGSATITASGGTGPYQYKLNSGSFQSSNTFNGLATGVYTVTVQDVNGCQATASVTISDTGSDLYESNDNISPSLFALQLNQPIQARIAPTKNDKDYFKFTTGAIPASYTLSLTNSPISYTFAIYDSKGKVVNPISFTATTKTYNSLAVNTAYYPGVTGTSWSLLCYTLAISNTVPPAIVSTATRQENKDMVIDKLNTSVFPNPHHGSFGIKIESAQNGTATIEILNSLGQMISTKRIAVNKGGVSIANFTGMHHPVLFYRVSIGNEMKTGKIIGPN